MNWKKGRICDEAMKNQNLTLLKCTHEECPQLPDSVFTLSSCCWHIWDWRGKNNTCKMYFIIFNYDIHALSAAYQLSAVSKGSCSAPPWSLNNRSKNPYHPAAVPDTPEPSNTVNHTLRTSVSQTTTPKRVQQHTLWHLRERSSEERNAAQPTGLLQLIEGLWSARYLGLCSTNAGKASSVFPSSAQTVTSPDLTIFLICCHHQNNQPLLNYDGFSSTGKWCWCDDIIRRKLNPTALWSIIKGWKRV